MLCFWLIWGFILLFYLGFSFHAFLYIFSYLWRFNWILKICLILNLRVGLLWGWYLLFMLLVLWSFYYFIFTFIFNICIFALALLNIILLTQLTILLWYLSCVIRILTFTWFNRLLTDFSFALRLNLFFLFLNFSWVLKICLFFTFSIELLWALHLFR